MREGIRSWSTLAEFVEALARGDHTERFDGLALASLDALAGIEGARAVDSDGVQSWAIDVYPTISGDTQLWQVVKH